jgi:NDP-sugar pyrophosphorylase family protein
MPGERTAVGQLSRHVPLVLQSVFGRPLLDYWLEKASTLGIDRITMLVTDRPDQIRKYVQDGGRWGMCIEVLPARREMTPEEAARRYGIPIDRIQVMEKFPESEWESFSSYQTWFLACRNALEQGLNESRPACRQVLPGVWKHLHAQVHPDAILRAPCWIGDQVRVGAGCVIGPGTILEDRVYIDAHATVENSFIAPDVFVGEGLDVRDALVLGSTMIKHTTSTVLHVPDTHLICDMSLRTRTTVDASRDLLGRLAAILVIAFTLPAVVAWLLVRKTGGLPSLVPKVAIRPQWAGGGCETMIYYEFETGHRFLRRWPQLWNVVWGDFTWVGNPPLSPTEALWLTQDFEKLWLSAPVGIFSLADAQGCSEFLSYEGRVHASFYSVQTSWRLNASILFHILLALLGWKGTYAPPLRPIQSKELTERHLPPNFAVINK